MTEPQVKYTAFNRDDAAAKIASELLDTWQPLACIAARCGLSVKLTHNVLMEMRDDGNVAMARGRVDGHNLVYSFRRVKYIRVLGMRIMETANDIS